MTTPKLTTSASRARIERENRAFAQETTEFFHITSALLTRTFNPAEHELTSDAFSLLYKTIADRIRCHFAVRILQLITLDKPLLELTEEIGDLVSPLAARADANHRALRNLIEVLLPTEERTEKCQSNTKPSATSWKPAE